MIGEACAIASAVEGVGLPVPGGSIHTGCYWAPGARGRIGTAHGGGPSGGEAAQPIVGVALSLALKVLRVGGIDDCKEVAGVVVVVGGVRKGPG
ncbi:hypothetical protein ADL26_19270, partial [Thermoactinomyces vulgaris]